MSDPVPPTVSAVRGALAYLRDDPFRADPAHAFVHVPDGLVVCDNGIIRAAGPAAALLPTLPPGARVDDRRGCLVCPGFVDTHVHYVQTGMIASYAGDLLDWLEKRTFVAEQAFADRAAADAMAALFCDELLRNGTTTALVFCAVYPQSVDALFEAAARRNLRLAAGKVLMDRNAPPALLDTAQAGYDDSKTLIARWHGRGRALYAVTPRFAGTSTAAQLDAAGALLREHPGVLMQTHIAENRREVAWIAALFPDRAGYLDVYDHHGLIGGRSVLAHGIHMSEAELCRCHAAGAALAHCPTSNMFLGSGLFGLRRARDPARPVEVGLGTDIGAGTSFSLLATMGAAYKVAALAGDTLTAVEALYLATLGGARTLGLDALIGTLQPGREADLVVLDPAATPLLAQRTARAESIEDMLFALMTLGDDRCVRATYVAGTQAYANPAGAG
ncbi:MAG: guanine deaminase [Rhodospirillales bacterium]